MGIQGAGQQVADPALCSCADPVTCLPCSEKNWAFRELDGELLILHKLAPVTTFLRIMPAAPKGLELVSATSYWTVPHRVQILSHAGLSFDEEVRCRCSWCSMHASDASPPCVALTCVEASACAQAPQAPLAVVQQCFLVCLTGRSTLAATRWTSPRLSWETPDWTGATVSGSSWRTAVRTASTSTGAPRGPSCT